MKENSIQNSLTIAQQLYTAGLQNPRPPEALKNAGDVEAELRAAFETNLRYGSRFSFELDGDNNLIVTLKAPAINGGKEYKAVLQPLSDPDRPEEILYDDMQFIHAFDEQNK